MSNTKVENLKLFLKQFNEESSGCECLQNATPLLIERTGHEEIHILYEELYTDDIAFILSTCLKYDLRIKIEAVSSEVFLILIYP